MIDDVRVAMLAAILVFSGFAGMTAAYGAAATEPGSVDAQVQVVHEEPIDLPGTDVENESVAINGTQLEAGEDYALDRRRGHIYFLEDGNATAGDTADVSYEAQLPERLAERIRGPLGNATVLAGAGVFVLLVLIAISALGTLRGRW